MKKKIIIVCVSLVSVVASLLWGLPAFAQTYIATKIPNQPLSQIAANQIINHSGLLIEILPDGTTNEITRGRDAVNAYRYAHGQLYTNGWYRGISEDHTPLLIAMVNELQKQGFISSEITLQDKSAEVLQKFWYASDTNNAKGLGFDSLEQMQATIKSLLDSGKSIDAKQIQENFDSMWK